MATVAETLVELVRKYDSPAVVSADGHPGPAGSDPRQYHSGTNKDGALPGGRGGHPRRLDEMKAMDYARVNFITIDPEWTGEVVQFINSEARPQVENDPGNTGLALLVSGVLGVVITEPFWVFGTPCAKASGLWLNFVRRF